LYKTAEACDNAGFTQLGALVDCYDKCVKKDKFFDFKCLLGATQLLVSTSAAALAVLCML